MAGVRLRATKICDFSIEFSAMYEWSNSSDFEDMAYVRSFKLKFRTFLYFHYLGPS